MDAEIWAVFNAYFETAEGQAWRDQVRAEMRDSGMDEDEFIEKHLVQPFLARIKSDLGHE